MEASNSAGLAFYTEGEARRFVVNTAKRDDESSKLPNPNAQEGPVRIVVVSTGNGRKWRASLEGVTLCTSTSPLVAAARILIERGFDPTGIIELWHAAGDEWALRGRLGAVAATVCDGEKVDCPARNSPPARSNGEGAT